MRRPGRSSDVLYFKVKANESKSPSLEPLSRPFLQSSGARGSEQCEQGLMVRLEYEMTTPNEFPEAFDCRHQGKRFLPKLTVIPLRG